MKILVIEDNRKHQQDARNFFAQHPEIQATYASTFGEVLGHLRKEKFDGVISDIFFPHSFRSPWDSEEPCGVGVMMLCHHKGIPCILNTAGYHHGARYDWICQVQRELKLPEMVDAGEDYHKEADTKDWEKALKWVTALIKKEKI